MIIEKKNFFNLIKIVISARFHLDPEQHGQRRKRFYTKHTRTLRLHGINPDDLEAVSRAFCPSLR